MAAIRIRKGGKITLPAEYRRKYGVKEGDVFNIVGMKNGFLLSPAQPLRVEKPAAQARQKTTQNKQTTE